MNSTAEPFLNQMGTQEHYSYPSSDPSGQLVTMSPPPVTGKESAAKVYLTGKGSQKVQPFEDDDHIPENVKLNQSRNGELNICKQWFANQKRKHITVFFSICACFILHFVWLSMTALVAVDIIGHHYSTNNITFYNMQGNLTPFLNASQKNGEVQSGTIHRLYDRDEGKYIPYKVASGPCKPNKQGRFESMSPNISVGEIFLPIFAQKWLNRGTSFDISFQSDLLGGKYMTAYLVRHSCSLAVSECISNGIYTKALKITNTNKEFTITIPEDGYYYLFIKSGIRGEYIIASWEFTCDYNYYTYVEPEFTYICHVPDVEDGPPCTFQINKTQCYFLETESYEYFSPRIYEYQLDYTTDQKHTIKDEVHYTVVGAVFLIASIALSVILTVFAVVVLLLFCIRKRKNYDALL